jgi:hypothetical protein
MPIFTVFLTGQATVLREQRVYAENEEEANENAANYASHGSGDPENGWRIDPGQRVTNITAEVVSKH